MKIIKKLKKLQLNLLGMFIAAGKRMTIMRTEV